MKKHLLTAGLILASFSTPLFAKNTIKEKNINTYTQQAALVKNVQELVANERIIIESVTVTDFFQCSIKYSITNANGTTVSGTITAADCATAAKGIQLIAAFL